MKEWRVMTTLKLSPCGMSAATQLLPVQIEEALGTVRWMTYPNVIEIVLCLQINRE